MGTVTYRIQVTVVFDVVRYVETPDAVSATLVARCPNVLAAKNAAEALTRYEIENPTDRSLKINPPEGEDLH